MRTRLIQFLFGIFCSLPCDIHRSVSVEEIKKPKDLPISAKLKASALIISHKFRTSGFPKVFQRNLCVWCVE
ncbi:hypothetical protein K438DRAFT_916831 [Mycena galopus ATCC 62051]|nr:hypothetical protein K438DRAFT_916831 [Mycena galopus ATCC 62051]